MKTFKRSYVVTIEGEFEPGWELRCAAGSADFEPRYLEEGAKLLADGAERFWQIVLKPESRTVTVAACDKPEANTAEDRDRETMRRWHASAAKAWPL